LRRAFPLHRMASRAQRVSRLTGQKIRAQPIQPASREERDRNQHQRRESACHTSGAKIIAPPRK